MSCLQYKKRDIKSVAHAAKLLAAFESGGILTPKQLITQTGLSRGRFRTIPQGKAPD